jgi:hypothetical protein
LQVAILSGGRHGSVCLVDFPQTPPIDAGDGQDTDDPDQPQHGNLAANPATSEQ